MLKNTLSGDVKESLKKKKKIKNPIPGASVNLEAVLSQDQCTYCVSIAVMSIDNKRHISSSTNP